MARVVAVEDLRARLGRELDALCGTPDELYISNGGRVIGVLLDVDHYAGLLDRFDYLGDSLVARNVRSELDTAVSWVELRE